MWKIVMNKQVCPIFHWSFEANYLDNYRQQTYTICKYSVHVSNQMGKSEQKTG